MYDLNIPTKINLLEYVIETLDFVKMLYAFIENLLMIKEIANNNANLLFAYSY